MGLEQPEGRVVQALSTRNAPAGDSLNRASTELQQSCNRAEMRVEPQSTSSSLFKVSWGRFARSGR
jgi:hypothetical protein